MISTVFVVRLVLLLWLGNKANKDPNNFKVILLTFPNIVDS